MGKKNGNGTYKSNGHKNNKEYVAKRREPKVVKEANFSNRHIVCSKILKPKTINQSKYLKSIEDNTITMGIGCAGTGKTMLATYYAIQQLLQKNYTKLIITRPIVQAGEDLGFLPGELEAKVDPYMRPIIDAIRDIVGPNYKEWMDYHVEIAPLAYLRGRTFNDCFVILDEGQNTTKEQFFMFLTRLGEGSKAVITADPTQIDLERKKDSGIFEAMEFLDGQVDIKLIYFSEEDVIRSQIVRQIVNAYERGRYEKKLDKEKVHGNTVELTESGRD